MIYTVTFNPSIDQVMDCGSLTLGTVNRAVSEDIFFGGKGINVSLILAELGVPSCALGFTAGFTGAAIERGIAEKGVTADFIRLASGFSRINVKLHADSETEINGRGPHIPADKLNELYDKLDRLKEGDILVLAGSIPPSLPADTYETILSRLDKKGIRTVVDASGKLLLNTLKYKPYLIKPNNFELGELFGVTAETREDAAKYAAELQKMGARNILVSMAEKGSVLLDENGNVHSRGVFTGEVKSSVGAGDSMLAGFIAGMETGDYDYALRLGTAAGGATAFSKGLADREKIMSLMALE